MKMTTMGGTLLAAALLMTVPGQAAAQMGQGRGMRAERRPEPGVETILRMKERLDLTEEQINRLEGLRQAVVAHRAQRAAEMEDLRSRARAGDFDRDAWREQARARREAAQAFSENVRGQVEEILTDAQREQLQEIRGRARAFQRGRASAMRGGRGGAMRSGPRGAMRSGRDGVRGGRGALRGGRGAWGPAQRGCARGLQPAFLRDLGAG